MRFARAIAADLAVSRHDVRASVMGEHGQAMIPLWRSVELIPGNYKAADHLEQLCSSIAEPALEKRVSELLAEVKQLLSEERIAQAYSLTQAALPDARIFVEPYITAHCMHSTPNATANATLQCVAAALANDHRRIHGQFLLKSEVLGLDGVCGIPITIGANGWRVEPMYWLEADEIESVHKATRSIYCQSSADTAEGLSAEAW